MKKIFKWAIIIFIILFIIIVYARYVGTLGFDTKEYIIKNNDIPNSFDGLKIVHFSDIHYNRAITLTKIEEIVEEINLINPDIVVFTGDLIDKDVKLTNQDYSNLTKVLRKIKSKYGNYAVMGNHDYYADHEKIENIYNDSNFKYLANSYDIIYSKELEKIFIGGINTVSYDMANIEETFSYFKDHDDINYKIILVHEPDIVSDIVKDYQVNLILAGHSHNGQIRLPFIGPIYTPPYSKKYYDNYYNINGTDLYISSGIGVSTINYRLFDRPSINFYRIYKEATN